jgi:hypothetical protein
MFAQQIAPSRARAHARQETRNRKPVLRVTVTGAADVNEASAAAMDEAWGRRFDPDTEVFKGTHDFDEGALRTYTFEYRPSRGW